jgi:hypothetical protein
MMIIYKNKHDQSKFSRNGLFSTGELDGIELNGGDDDFGDEMLLRSNANDHRH